MPYKPPSSRYLAYLLRLWKEADSIRIMLEDVHKQEKHLFTDLHDLWAFLEQILASSSDDSD